MRFISHHSIALPVAATLVLAFGCSSDNNGGGAGGDGLGGAFLFACDNPAGTKLAASVHGCVDHYVGQMGDSARAPLEQSCTTNGGTVLETPCVDAGKVGACVIRAPGTDVFGLYSVDWLYLPSIAAEVQQSCFRGGYDFKQADGTIIPVPGGADAGTDGAPASTGEGAVARVVNGMQGLNFAVWVVGAGGQPVMAADVPFGTVSDYFDVPFEASKGEPWFMVVPSDTRPEAGQTLLDFDYANESVRFTLEPADRTTVLYGKGLAGGTFGVSWQSLEESALVAPHADEASVHLSTLTGLMPPGAKLAVLGEPCLTPDGFDKTVLFTLPAGSTTLAVYPSEVTATPCSDLVPLATLDLELEGGSTTLLFAHAEDDKVVVKSFAVETE